MGACDGTRGEGQGEAEAEEGGGRPGIFHSALREHQPASPRPQTLASGAVTSHVCSFRPPSLWHFILAALAQECRGVVVASALLLAHSALAWLGQATLSARPADLPVGGFWWQPGITSIATGSHTPSAPGSVVKTMFSSQVLPAVLPCPRGRPQRPESRLEVMNFRANCTHQREIPERHLLTPNPAHHGVILTVEARCMEIFALEGGSLR